MKEIIDEYLEGYRLRYHTPRFAGYALGHVSRLVGAKIAVDIDVNSVLAYQEERLREFHNRNRSSLPNPAQLLHDA